MDRRDRGQAVLEYALATCWLVVLLFGVFSLQEVLKDAMLARLRDTQERLAPPVP